MRILLIASSYPPVVGGLQTAVHTLAQEFMAGGHEVLVVANRFPRTLRPGEQIDGVPVRRLLFLKPALEQIGRGRLDLFLAGCAVYPATLLMLWRLCRGFRPDVVNVHFPLGQNRFVLWLRKRFSFRLVVSLHGSEILGLTDEGRIRTLEKVLKEAEAVTACSRFLLAKAVELEPGVATKGSAIPNGIDPQRFLDKACYAHPRPYIFAFGRLTWLKGFDLLLRAFAEVADDCPEIDLILGGDGAERSALLHEAAALGVGARVRFAGNLNPVDVVRYLNGCRFLVVPSRSEPFGIVALEGLAAGKPVLATNTGGLPEALAFRPDDTLLVQLSVEGLRDGMKEWLQRGSAVGSGAQDPTRALPQWSECAGQYLALYRND